jgi:hypothetical protein
MAIRIGHDSERESGDAGGLPERFTKNKAFMQNNNQKALTLVTALPPTAAKYKIRRLQV